jgi:hypothetical protein
MPATFSLGTTILELLATRTPASSPATIHKATFIESPLSQFKEASVAR